MSGRVEVGVGGREMRAGKRSRKKQSTLRRLSVAELTYFSKYNLFTSFSWEWKLKRHVRSQSSPFRTHIYLQMYDMYCCRQPSAARKRLKRGAFQDSNGTSEKTHLSFDESVRQKDLQCMFRMSECCFIVFFSEVSKDKGEKTGASWANTTNFRHFPCPSQMRLNARRLS